MEADLTFSESNDAAAEAFASALISGTPPDSPADGSGETTSPNTNGDQRPADGSAGIVEGSPAEPIVEPKADDFDPAKTLAKYETPEERDLALVESQRTILERSRENQMLRSEIDSLKAGRPADAPATPASAAPAEQYGEFLARVHGAKDEVLDPAERGVKAVLSELAGHKASLDSLTAQLTERRTHEAALVNGASQLENHIALLKKDLEEDPDDFSLKERIAKTETKLSNVRERVVGAKIERLDVESGLRQAQSDWNNRIVHAENAAKATFDGRNSVTQQAFERASREQEVQESWQKSSETLLKDLEEEGLTTYEQTTLLTALQAALYEENARTGKVPEDFYVWQKSRRDVVDGFLKSRGESVDAVTRRRGSSHLPSRPRDNAAPARTNEGKSKSFKDSMREADAMLDRALGI